ncbi:MAG: leucine-rich repeat protein [Lachnospiraceae bacterium]|nr:leucine-rich repeat protein [Lachnospiraceae bacterium]
MAKSTKKKNRKLRKQIRKTVGALFMVSAIVVAAVPVQDVAANPHKDESNEYVDKPSEVKIAVWDDYHYGASDNSSEQNTNVIKNSACKSTIPYVRDFINSTTNETEKDKYRQIYTSESGDYQFAYIPKQAGDTERVAVILRFSGTSEYENVTIPNELEAYRKISLNQSGTNYCVVNEDNNFLYYKEEIQLSYNGNLLYEVPSITYGDGASDENDVPLSGSTLIVDSSMLTDGKFVVKPITNEDGTQSLTNTVYDYTRKDTNKIEADVGTYEVIAHMGMSDYKPCLSTTRDKWKDLGYATEQLFYHDDTNNNGSVDENEMVMVADTSDERVIANVRFIGAEQIEEDPSELGTWKLVSEDVNSDAGIIDEPNEGVFANNTNIKSLTIGENIEGISDFAFYGCGSMTNVTFSGRLSTISNGAFANCIGLTSVNMDTASNVQAIGKDAFYRCTNLTSFTMPVSVKAIGDCAFEGCNRLTDINLCTGASGDTFLEKVGYHVFKDCESLSSVTFPNTYPLNEGGDEIDICCFENCSSLQFVKSSNPYFKIVDSVEHPEHTRGGQPCASNSFTKVFETGQKVIPGTFYFEGVGYLGTSQSENNRTHLHKTANDNEIAFKYLEEELYELVVKEEPDAKITYQVNNYNELVKVGIDGNPENITIPATIGPYGIAAIGAGSFNNLQCCNLKKVTIPASVTSIGTRAFQGCHDLESVVFEDASTIQNIETDAFKTQETVCDHELYDPNGAGSVSKPKLTFVGAMMNAEGGDTVPFMYAMNGVSNINNADQEKIWITCHSGWPTNLEVEYYFDALAQAGEAQLVGYPRYSIIGSDDDEIVKAWVEALPYTDGDCDDAGSGNPDDPDNETNPYVPPSTAYIYYQKVKNAISKCVANDPTNQPTEEEYSIYNSAKNLVVPTSVDSIKTGLFSGWAPDADLDGEADDITNVEPDTEIETITLNGVDRLEPYTFTGCEKLREIGVIGCQSIDDYAFSATKDGKTDSSIVTNLASVTLGTNITEVGKRPFAGCTNLANINCLGNNLAFDNGLLYQTTGDKTLIECLPGRGKTVGSYTVGPEELVGLMAIQEEAFMDCDEIGQVDLTQSSIDVIPIKCFYEDDELVSVYLPNTLQTIETDSFRETERLRLVQVPSSVTYIEQEAFELTGVRDEDTADEIITFQCVEKSAADRYAKMSSNPYINPEYGKIFLTHTVYFYDRDPVDPSITTFLDKQIINNNEDAIPPASPTREGYIFTGWTPYTNITKDTDVYANYVAEGAASYEVKFFDTIAGVQLGETQIIEEGKSAIPPTAPEHDGYTFKGWIGEYNNIQKDTDIFTDYSNNAATENQHKVTFVYFDGTTLVTHSVQTVAHEGAATTPVTPTRSGYSFVGWNPSDYSNVTEDMTITGVFEKTSSNTDGGGGGGTDKGNSDKKNNASPSPSASPSVKKYTVSVSGGSGSGSYAAGDIVAINAYYRGTGQSFDKWTTSTAGVGFANNEAASTTFTMPATNVAVTATYKVGGASTTTTTGGNTTGGTTGTTSSGNVNGSSVQITKPGISNTGLAGATVSGATDNFIVKVTEDQNATNAVVTALQTKFGDISRIKYWPMDISLYDSTGRTKIADTSGISVNLTLPIPDELVQYAGNNRVAAVNGGVLEDLNTRFTTVDGVPCVNFTASHFSPYVIYVDTANLSAGTIDATPKTGDGIHPKWFLSIGMACIALVLFFKRDKAVVPARTA